MLQNLLPFVPYPIVGNEPACNLCGSKDAIHICSTDRRLKPLNTVACADCGLMRSNPMPTDEELSRYYSSHYRADYQFASSKPPKIHRVRCLRRAEYRTELLKDWLKPGSRVLDVGCGSGEFAYLAKQAGCEVVAFDPGGEYLDFARDEYGVEAFISRWEDADLEPGSFDVITCFHVVEHLRKPVDALRQMAAWAKPDGIMYIAVPDMRPNNKPSFDRFHFAHVHGFIAETLEAALGVAGMVPVKGHLATTAGVFRKAQAEGNAIEHPIPVKDQKRAIYLKDHYPDDSVVSYVMSGKWARNAGYQVSKWCRDFVTRTQH